MRLLSSAAVVVLLGLFSFGCQMSSSASRSGPNEPKAENSEEANKKGTPTPVLVELFTSEGCSSCPPAEKALIFLDKEQPVSGAQIVALELHVDYWDGPSWKDPFSSASFTQRQNWYAQKFHLDQIFTPQMVADGTSQFIGSDLQTANIMIVQLAKEAKANVLVSQSGEKLKIKIDPFPVSKESTVFLAIAENNMETKVKGGENSGLKLSHTAVVRQLGAVGNLKADNKGFEAEVTPHFEDTWKAKDLKAVVFIQENESGRVIGIRQLSLVQK
jgi:hypothetical protein